MARFSDNFRERVRAANDIVDVIGAALPLKRNGANFVCLCPFHKEKSPSFNVNSSKQIFHCFGCHAGGDVFKFVQMYENISFPEAIERLAERARIPLEYEGSGGNQESRGTKDALLKLHEAICLRWQHCLTNEPTGQIARDYLAKRGVAAEAIKEFRIGAAPEAWDDTVNWAKSRGFEAAVCEQAGLIIRKAETGRLYDRFRGRLMFPICDEQGRVIAFSGRVLQGDEKTAKYVNSPETPIFTKGRVLFALDKAKRAILDAGHAVVCEGQLDTIACHSAGIRHVVAPQGTALTPEHARILKRYVDEVVLCFDGDKAGRDASIRSFDGLLGSGLAVRVASIPPPDDPDSFLKNHGTESFRGVLSRAEGYFEFYLRHLLSEHNVTTDRGRILVVRAMAEAVQKTGNAVLIDTYAQKVSQRLGVDVSAVRAEFRKARAANPVAEPVEPPLEEAAAVPSRPPELELWLLKYLVISPALGQFAAHHLDPHWLTHATVRKIVGLHFSTGGDVAGLLSHLEQDDFARSLVTEAASERRALPNPEASLADTLLRLRNNWLDQQMAEATRHLADPALNDSDRLAVLVELQRLRAAKKRPLEPLDPIESSSSEPEDSPPVD
ncbi:MAG: DNA primase [Verrucomicrobia bacterium]|nr:DNA primase [Verrucomicrobiota bacterium]